LLPVVGFAQPGFTQASFKFLHESSVGEWSGNFRFAGRIATVSAGSDDFADFVAKFVYFLRRIRLKKLRGEMLIPFVLGLVAIHGSHQRCAGDFVPRNANSVAAHARK
jgi:hypothetical protein